MSENYEKLISKGTMLVQKMREFRIQKARSSYANADRSKKKNMKHLEQILTTIERIEKETLKLQSDKEQIDDLLDQAEEMIRDLDIQIINFNSN